VPNRTTGSCLDPGLPGTGLQGGASQLEPGRDGQNMMRINEESIREMMQKDQRPTERTSPVCLYNIVNK
jgi:hypothetical protein